MEWNLQFDRDFFHAVNIIMCNLLGIFYIFLCRYCADTSLQI